MSKNIPLLTRNGASLPCVGLGTMVFPDPEKAPGLISHAINIGYTHIDTARKYGSEEWVGEGLRASNASRDDIWITTKVTEDDAKANDFARSVDDSLKAMQLDYVDLLLIHWPSRTVPLKETIGALNKAKRDGLAKNIGVSNFTVSLIEEAVHLSDEPLFCNQVEYHAYINQDKVLAACRKYGLFVECHVPLGRGRTYKDPLIVSIAEKHGKTGAQVALKWLIQQDGVAVLPGSTNPGRIEENIDLFDFELTSDEMSQISELRTNNIRAVNPEVRRPVWDEV